jgi:hypothetical protein
MLALLLAALALVGCGETRPRGEPGGVPVAFSIDFNGSYLEHVVRPGPPPAPLFVPAPYHPYGWYAPHYYGAGRPYGYRPYGYPYGYHGLYDDPWYGHGYVDVLLLGGDGPAEGGVFRMPLSEGHTDVAIPIRAGHVITLTVQARGDLEGWEAVGHFTAADRPGQRVQLTLVPAGPRLEVTEPAEGPPPAPTAP